jgi:hypothetical protein
LCILWFKQIQRAKAGRQATTNFGKPPFSQLTLPIVILHGTEFHVPNGGYEVHLLRRQFIYEDVLAGRIRRRHQNFGRRFQQLLTKKFFVRERMIPMAQDQFKK